MGNVGKELNHKKRKKTTKELKQKKAKPRTVEVFCFNFVVIEWNNSLSSESIAEKERKSNQRVGVSERESGRNKRDDDLNGWDPPRGRQIDR